MTTMHGNTGQRMRTRGRLPVGAPCMRASKPPVGPVVRCACVRGVARYDETVSLGHDRPITLLKREVSTLPDRPCGSAGVPRTQAGQRATAGARAQ